MTNSKEPLLQLKKSAHRNTGRTMNQSKFRPLQVRVLGQRRVVPSGRRMLNALLLCLELAAVVAVAYVAIVSLGNWQALAAPPPQGPSTPMSVQSLKEPIPVILPGQHEPPDAAYLPRHLQGLVKPIPAVTMPTAAPGRPTRIVIPKLGVDSPIVEGDDAEALKMAVGHRIGSANPGQRGNMILSGHNDIYGEVFRDLDQLAPGDTLTVYSNREAFDYVVRMRKVVEPTDTSVLEQSSGALVTLITCYPYLIDTHRLVVVAELCE